MMYHLKDGSGVWISIGASLPYFSLLLYVTNYINVLKNY